MHTWEAIQKPKQKMIEKIFQNVMEDCHLTFWKNPYNEF